MSISILPDPIFNTNSDGWSIYFIISECHWNFSSTIELKSNKIFKQHQKIGSNINENCIGFFFVCLCCLPYSKIYVAPSSFISRGVNTRRVKKSMKIINMKASYIIIFLYYINMFGKFFFIKSKLYFIFCKIKHDSIKFTFYIKNLHTHKNSNYFHSPTSSLFLLLLV